MISHVLSSDNTWDIMQLVKYSLNILDPLFTNYE